MIISFFCPENNINDNPSLGGIVGLLCDEGHELDIVVARRGGTQRESQVALHPKARVQLVDSSFFKSGYLSEIPPLDTSRANLNIGVDADGVIVATHFSRKHGIPVGMISYEIFFATETVAGSKIKEICACKDIKFAVVSDPIRGQLLTQENKIPVEKLIYIPVAGRRTARISRSHFLHDKLGIPHDRKIAIMAGSISRWTMADRILRNAADWPPDWTLVLHSRYGVNSIEPFILWLLRRQYPNNVVVSQITVKQVSDLDTILSAVDLGLAFYAPTFDSQYHGQNIKNVGLSSGKIATYLRHGVPVACNEIGQMSDFVRRYNLGIVVRAPEELSTQLKSLGDQREACFDFFDKHLALEGHVRSLLLAIENCK